MVEPIWLLLLFSCEKSYTWKIVDAWSIFALKVGGDEVKICNAQYFPILQYLFYLRTTLIGHFKYCNLKDLMVNRLPTRWL